MKELKPCPACGGDDVALNVPRGPNGFASVQCHTCSTTGPLGDYYARGWNAMPRREDIVEATQAADRLADRVAELESNASGVSVQPMSRERFRQEAILCLTRLARSGPATLLNCGQTVDFADELTITAFGEEAE